MEIAKKIFDDTGDCSCTTCSECPLEYGHYDCDNYDGDSGDEMGLNAATHYIETNGEL
jgi:hypothetical protein